MGLGHEFHLLSRFREGNVHAALAPFESFEEEFQGQSGFADSGIALDQVETVGGQASAEDFVETCNAGGAQGVRFRSGRGFHNCGAGKPRGSDKAERAHSGGAPKGQEI